MSRQSESCQTEVRLILLSITDEDVKAEVTCVAQNAAGRREALVQIQLEGDFYRMIKDRISTSSTYPGHTEKLHLGDD